MKTLQDFLSEGIKGGKNIHSGRGRRFEVRETERAIVEDKLQILHGRDAGEVAFVVLNYQRETGERRVVVMEIAFHTAPCSEIFLHSVDLAVGNEDDAIHAFENHLASRIVVHLTGNGVEHEARL